MNHDIEQLIHDVLHGSASATDRRSLSDWITADDANARDYLRVAMDERGIRASLERSAARSIEELDASPEDSGAGMLLAQLAQAEAEADAPLVELIDLRMPWWETHARPLMAAAGIAVAAVIALAVILLVGPATDSSQSNTPLANETNTTPALPQGLPFQTVATLTAAHNATWAGGALAPGSELRPGDRLTLTQGFAEITTEEGAVVILEAPAIVELLDSNNALRLHTGKLIGICETESSKGFLVRTPHMDVIDLGTRFGVDASQVDATEVHVFEGEVQAARIGTASILLGADQSARASADNPAIATIDHDTERFAAIRDESKLGPPSSTTVLDTDTSGTQWLITTSQYAGSETYLGNRVTCSVDNTGFTRGVVGNNAYGFIQHQVEGAGSGQAATATGTWTFSNLPAGRYDVATAFTPTGADAVRYTINGDEALVDQSALPASDAGPGFSGGIVGYKARVDDIQFTLIGSSVVVPEGGTITVTIDNSNIPMNRRANMDSVAITLVPEAGRD